MKEMIYKPNRIFEILEQNQYKGYNYFVCSLGTHPTAYIEIPKGHKLYGIEYYKTDACEIDCHGGLTYASSVLRGVEIDDKSERWFIGWDYAHSGDYYCSELSFYSPSLYNRRFETEDAIGDCKKVINQLVLMGDV